MSIEKSQEKINLARAWPFPTNKVVSKDTPTKPMLMSRTGIVTPGWSPPANPKPMHGFEGDLANLISLYQMDKDTGKTPAELASELVYEIEQRVIQQQH